MGSAISRPFLVFFLGDRLCTRSREERGVTFPFRPLVAVMGGAVRKRDPLSSAAFLMLKGALLLSYFSSTVPCREGLPSPVAEGDVS